MLRENFQNICISNFCLINVTKANLLQLATQPVHFQVLTSHNGHNTQGTSYY